MVSSRLATIKEIYRVLTRSDVKLQGGDMDMRVAVEEEVVHAGEFEHELERVSSRDDSESIEKV